MIKQWNIKKKRIQKLKYVIATYKSIQRSAVVMIASVRVTDMLMKSTLTNI